MSEAIILHPSKCTKMSKTRTDKLFVNHLSSLSREELIALVLKFAPEGYQRTIELAEASPKEKEVGFTEVKKTIEQLDWSAYPTYEQIDEMMLSTITKLRPFWSLYPTEVLEVYRDLAVSMHNAQEDGALYDRMQDVYMEVGWAHEVIDFLETLTDDQYEAAIKELSTIRESLEWISAAYVVDPE
jgi:hypothetical protein